LFLFALKRAADKREPKTIRNQGKQQEEMVARHFAALDLTYPTGNILSSMG